MSNISNETENRDTIVISDILNNMVTITSKELSIQNISENFVYNISPDGKIIIGDLGAYTDNKINFDANKGGENREALIVELIKSGFEEIPEYLNESQLKKMLDFFQKTIIKRNDYSRMFPFSVEMTDNGDLKAILLMYNGSENSLSLTKFPFKLRDAKEEVIIVDIVDINKTVSPNRINICEVYIEKERLINREPDLTSWIITFEM